MIGFQQPAPGEHVVVVSPHLDDAVLSFGSAMSGWARRGVRVELLTVFGCDPESTAATGGWDRRGGFATEGESARSRRVEDAKACEILGVTPRWLAFGSVDYDRHGDETAVAEVVFGAIESADLVVFPGFPLSHPDHDWLVRTVLSTVRGSHRVSFYAEQPYASRTSEPAQLPSWLVTTIGGAPGFAAGPRSLRDVVAKWRAVRCYRSQLELLALGGVRRGAMLAWSRELLTERWLEWSRG